MRLLDLFCGAGGAAVGYHRAGFDEIVGVDICPQPRYPFEFFQDDALEVLGADINASFIRSFDAIHASPPCQAYSTLRPFVESRFGPQNYPELIEPTRDLLRSTRLPWVIENVERAPLGREHQCVMLCPKALGVGNYRNHRRFEISGFCLLVPPCPGHRLGRTKQRITGFGAVARSQTELAHPRRAEVASRRFSTVHEDQTSGSWRHAAELKQIDWMKRDELAQAIPPAYTQFIGEQLIDQIKRGAA